MKNVTFTMKLIAFFSMLIILIVGLSIGIKAKEQTRIENGLSQVNYAWLDSYGLAHVVIKNKKQDVFKGHALSAITASSQYIVGLTQDNKIVYSSLSNLSQEKVSSLSKYGISFSSLNKINENSFGFIATKGKGSDAVDTLMKIAPESGDFTSITNNTSDVIQNWFGVDGKIVYKYGTSKNPTVFDTKTSKTTVIPISMSSELKGYFYLNKQLVIWGKSTDGFTKKTVGYSLKDDNVINLDKSLNGNGSNAEQILSYNNEFYWFIKSQIGNTGIFDYSISSSQSRLFSSASFSFGDPGFVDSSGSFIYVPVINGAQRHDVLVLSIQTGRQVSTIKNTKEIILIK